MNRGSFLAVAAILFLLLPANLPAQQITVAAYRPIFRQVSDLRGTPLIAIRSFRQNTVPLYLLVDPATLRTRVAPAASFTPREESTATATPYQQALQRYNAPPFRLQNHGAARADRPVEGVFLTVDLCPSTRPFERELFDTLTALGGAVPVAIAISGRWLERSGAELAWLTEQEARGKLAITWVNHSDHHPFAPRLPLERNFLLTAGTDFTREVLDLEVKLLERGVIPSPFFRFPGLVADGKVLAILRELGLIPIGSDAWLAKGETPRPGSFILVHGNGNEPRGIAKVLPLLRGPLGKKLLPLAKAFAE